MKLYFPEGGGDNEIRTHDPLLARQVLSQLSYTPIRSDLFSDRLLCSSALSCDGQRKLNSVPNISSRHHSDSLVCKESLADLPWLLCFVLLRKEVIQPHLPIRLPCYDLTPIINPTFGGALLAVTLPTSGVADSHGLTGGVYKPRERIHCSMLTCNY